MSRAFTGRIGGDALTQEYRRAIKKANVTGLAAREHYEMVFAALAAEQRQALCGSVPFAVALRDVGMDVGGVAFVGVHPPGAELPADVVEALVEINEVVEATGTQILAMREAGGAKAAHFGVSGRRDCGIFMMAVGDVQGSRVRDLSWTQDQTGEWVVSSFATEQAQLHGWPRSIYECVRADLAVLAPASSEEVQALTQGRQEAVREGRDDRPWITFAELAELVRVT
jgi:hypothetical protein